MWRHHLSRPCSQARRSACRGSDKPGQISDSSGLEHRIETSMPVALGFVLLAAIALSIPGPFCGFVSAKSDNLQLCERRARRRKGYEALTRGMIATGAGDAARRARRPPKSRGICRRSRSVCCCMRRWRSSAATASR